MIIISSCESWFINTLTCYPRLKTKKCGWRISFKNRTADFYIKFNISQTKMKTILSFSKGKCDTRYPHYSVLLSIPLLKIRIVADENPLKNCCYCSPFGLSPMLVLLIEYIYIYTLYAHQKLFWAQVKSTSKRKQAVTYSRAQKLILLLGDGQDEKTELLNPRTKCLSDCKIPSAMLKKILINQKMLTNFDDRIRIII